MIHHLRNATLHVTLERVLRELPVTRHRAIEQYPMLVERDFAAEYCGEQDISEILVLDQLVHLEKRR